MPEVNCCSRARLRVAAIGPVAGCSPWGDFPIKMTGVLVGNFEKNP